MAKFVQVFLLAFLVVAMIAPNEAFLFKHKGFYGHPVYATKHYKYVPAVVHRPVYYHAVPVYSHPKKIYKKKFYKKMLG